MISQLSNAKSFLSWQNTATCCLKVRPRGGHQRGTPGHVGRLGCRRLDSAAVPARQPGGATTESTHQSLRA